MAVIERCLWGKLTWVFLLSSISMGVGLRAQENEEVNNPRVDEKLQKKADSIAQAYRKLDATEVNILFSYYDQDGTHSAVTGGQGTEELSDYSSIIQVKVALPDYSRLSVSGGINFYTSASTDRIDAEMSSASSEDIRAQLYLNYAKSNALGLSEWEINGGISSESDYLSTSLGLAWHRESEDHNREIGLRVQAFFDRWLLIFPDELRGNAEATQVKTDRRNSLSFGLNYSQVLSPRWQMALALEAAWQQGLLSTPFHRVYFQEIESAQIEQLPNQRFKIPLGLRLHYFPLNNWVLRFYYRYYWDSFQIQAHSLQLESPIKIGPYFSVQPFYRFHRQRAARYFKERGLHSINSEFYTSDFDLSAFSSHKFGLGFRLAPLYGIGRFRLFSSKKVSLWEALELRAARYIRGDGLDAFIISMNLQFRIP